MAATVHALVLMLSKPMCSYLATLARNATCAQSSARSSLQHRASWYDFVVVEFRAQQLRCFGLGLILAVLQLLLTVDYTFESPANTRHC